MQTQTWLWSATTSNVVRTHVASCGSPREIELLTPCPGESPGTMLASLMGARIHESTEQSRHKDAGSRHDGLAELAATFARNGANPNGSKEMAGPGCSEEANGGAAMARCSDALGAASSESPCLERPNFRVSVQAVSVRAPAAASFPGPLRMTLPRGVERTLASGKEPEHTRAANDTRRPSECRPLRRQVPRVCKVHQGRSRVRRYGHHDMGIMTRAPRVRAPPAVT